MSKQRRREDPQEVERSAPVSELQRDEVLEASREVAPPSQAIEPAADRLGEQLTAHLSVAERDPAWSARLVEIVERSRLPADRREAVAERLRWDQHHADDVSRAVRTAVGRDDPEIRAALASALAGAPAGRDPVERLTAALTAVPGVSEPGARALVHSLALLELAWDEEEEEQGGPGETLAEETRA